MRNRNLGIAWHATHSSLAAKPSRSAWRSRSELWGVRRYGGPSGENIAVQNVPTNGRPLNTGNPNLTLPRFGTAPAPRSPGARGSGSPETVIRESRANAERIVGTF